MRQGLLVNCRCQVNHTVKQLNKGLLKYVFDMKSTRTFNRNEFAQYVKQVLAGDGDPLEATIVYKSPRKGGQQAQQAPQRRSNEGSGQRRQTNSEPDDEAPRNRQKVVKRTTFNV